MAKLTTAEVAKEYRVSQEYVREHAAEMGGRRLGMSRRSPLRFDTADLDRWWSSLPLGVGEPPQKPQRPGPKRHPSGVELLPLPSGH